MAITTRSSIKVKEEFDLNIIEIFFYKYKNIITK